MDALEAPDEYPARCRTCKQPLERKLLCSQCRIVVYCSIACQKKHWRSHRLACSAARAQRQLSSLLQRCDVRDAEKDFHLAAEHVRKLRREEPQSIKPFSKAAPVTASSFVAKKVGEGAASENEPNESQKAFRDLSIDHSYVHFKQTTELASSWCSFVVQNLSNLSCFNLRLNFTPFELPGLDRLLIQILHGTEGEDAYSTIVSIKFEARHMRIAFPAYITEASAQPTLKDDSEVNIRLSYRPQSQHQELSLKHIGMSRSTMERILCGFCDQKLIKSCSKPNTIGQSTSSAPGRIHFVSRLPSSRWDDMMDYLTCYPGEASVTLNTALIEGQLGRIMEDETAIVAHVDDLHASVLNGVPGYGQSFEDVTADSTLLALDGDASFRGNRPWRDCQTGPTVTCSYCASVLGLAPASQTVRLFKHRLQVHDHTKAMRPVSAISVFIAHEMIRYAETKAIFAFRVRRASHNRFLMLRILNWDNMVATSNDVVVLNDEVYQLQWKQMVQILHEETIDLSTDSALESNAWFWTRDWCCEAVGQRTVGEGEDQDNTSLVNAPVSSVRISLEEEEWDRLQKELILASSFFPVEIQTATVIAQTASDKARLSAIFLT